MNLTILQQQARKKYLDYIKLFPKFRPKNLAVYSTIILSLATMSFFIIFAIKPTIATIVQLNKQIKDSTFLDKALVAKIIAMRSLQEEYNTLSPDLPILDAGVPKQPNALYFLGQLQALAKQTNTSIVTLQTATIPLTKSEQLNKQITSFSFTVEIHGTYDADIAFLKQLANADRIVSLDTVSLSKSSGTDLTTSIQGKAYFHP